VTAVTLRRYVIVEDLVDKKQMQELTPALGLVTSSHPSLDSEPDVGLVTYMAFRDTDEGIALKACEELHHRHARFMLAWCIKHRNETFGESAESFVNTTFVKALNEAGSFVCTGQANGTNQVLAWLFRIMKNLYLDSLRAEKRRPVEHYSDEETEELEKIEATRATIAAQVPTRRKVAMLEFMETLSPKDREILTVTAEFWDPDKGEPVIDDDVREGICKDYGLTDSSLRVRRKRLKDRAKAFIQERTK
jgi:RNA polymerase sigma factor (sigma-70 family)